MFTFPVGFFGSEAPGGGDPFWSNVVLHLSGGGSNGSTTFIDSSNSAHTVTATGSATISNAQSRFGGSSIYLPSTSLSIPDSPNWDFSGDFTIRTFVYCLSHPSVVYFMGQTVSNAFAPLLPYVASGSVGIAASSTGSSWFVNNFATGAPVLSLNQWVYLVWTRSGNSWSIQVNDTVYPVGTGTYSGTPYAASQPMLIGGANSIYYFNGYVDEFQITNGVARPYTATPTAPFPIG